MLLIVMDPVINTDPVMVNADVLGEEEVMNRVVNLALEAVMFCLANKLSAVEAVKAVTVLLDQEEVAKRDPVIDTFPLIAALPVTCKLGTYTVSDLFSSAFIALPPIMADLREEVGILWFMPPSIAEKSDSAP